MFEWIAIIGSSDSFSVGILRIFEKVFQVVVIKVEGNP
jgi:hypothetical protein